MYIEGTSAGGQGRGVSRERVWARGGDGENVKTGLLGDGGVRQVNRGGIAKVRMRERWNGRRGKGDGKGKRRVLVRHRNLRRR